MTRVLNRKDIEIIQTTASGGHTAGLDAGKARKNISVPYTVADACEIGLTVNRMVMGVFERLNEKCRPSSRQVIQSFIRNCQQEAGFLASNRSYYLNCDLTRFYESGGMAEPELEHPEDEMFIQNYLARFIDGLEQLTEAVEQCSSSYLDELTVYSFCTSICQGVAALYQKMYERYPGGQMQEVLGEIYNKGLARLGSGNLR